MVFSSLFFTFFFLPVVVGVYYLSKDKYKNYILLIASVYFYSYGEPYFVLVMLGSIVFNYFIALLINKVQGTRSCFSKCILIFDIVVNLSLLFIYKYLTYTIHTANRLLHTNINIIKIVLPIGISFFTFQAMSYVIDVYRKKVDVQKNLFYLALYISFFPQLVAGPIVRYVTVSNQIQDRSHTLDKFAEGVRRFFLGFSKKVIIANNLSIIAAEIVRNDVVLVNPVILWIGSICYSLQIFYDFSGYSDMAIGLGKIFGFDFEENFNYPYISKSVTEFWRRWHISLGQWFRDYVYIPMGGGRCSFFRHIFNMFIVWCLTGIWHGANFTFIAWGLGYFFILVIEKYLVKPEKRKSECLKLIWQIFTLLSVNFGWVIFNSTSIKNGMKYCLAMLGFYKIPFAIDNDVVRYFREYGIIMLIGIIFSTPIVRILKTRIQANKCFIILGCIVPFVYAILFLLSVSYIILGTHNPFIYFNF